MLDSVVSQKFDLHARQVVYVIFTHQKLIVLNLKVLFLNTFKT